MKRKAPTTSKLQCACVLMIVAASFLPLALPVRADGIPPLELPPLLIEFVITDEPGLIEQAYRPRPRRQCDPQPCIEYADGTVNSILACYGDD